MGTAQTLEQSPHDPRVSDPGCLGTGYADAARVVPHQPCHGSGLITRERLAMIADDSGTTPAAAQSGGRPGEVPPTDPAAPGFPVPGYPA